MHCKVQILKKRISQRNSFRVPGVIFNLAEIIPTGRGFRLESDIEAVFVEADNNIQTWTGNITLFLPSFFV